MPLSSGQQLGPYEILAPLGAGGMGEVYRALDPRLQREVAIKVLPEHFVRDADSVQRFQTEARAIAALSHPNVVAVYDSGQEGDRLYVVTELLEGDTLRTRLKQGRFTVRKARDYGVQVAAGLASAHEKGIVHRDIKPENLFVTTDGRVKILDFGLARLDPPIDLGSGDDSEMPTAAPPTNPGAMIGTVGYLAPEQARGEISDHRADIFSLGAVLYEVLTGERAFGGASGADLITAVLRDEPPPPSERDPRIPKAMDLIVLHCLEKNPDERFQSARDLAFHLRAVGESVTQMGGTVPDLGKRRRWRTWATLGAATVAALAAGLIGGVALERRAERPQASQTERPPLPSTFRQLTDLPGEERSAHLGPDATAFVFVSRISGNADIYLQRVAGRNAINLTEDSPDDDTEPSISPDGELVAFRSERDNGGLFVMGSTGESVRRLTDFGFDPAWSPDGAFVAFSSADARNPWSRPDYGQLYVVEVASGEITQLTSGGDAVEPSWSPDGMRMAFWGLRGASGQRDIWTLPVRGAQTPQPVLVTDDAALDWNPIWSPDGSQLYFVSDRGGAMNVWRVPIDQASGELQGEPEPVTTPSRTAGSISLSADGAHMLFVSWDQRSTIQRLGLDPATGSVRQAPRPVLRGSRVLYTHDVSPDGARIAFSNLGVQEDIYVVGADGSGYRQLTDDVHRDRGPRWSPDGQRIAFYSNRAGRYDVWVVNADGSGLEPLTQGTGSAHWMPEWSPDGKRIAITDGQTTSIVDLDVPLAERLPRPLPGIDGRAMLPRSWSRDGRRLAGDLAYDVTPESVTLLYSLAERSYRALPDARGTPAWLSDSRRLVVARHDGLVLVDSATGDVSPLAEASPIEVRVSADDRWVTYLETVSEADVWLATLDR